MRRIPQLDGLRGIAILMVFLFHAFHIRVLWTGVDLFFVLSGYLITGVLLRLKEKRATNGYWQPFYIRRARRIVPPYLGFMLFVVLFVEVPWSRVWYWYVFFGANIATAFRIAVPSMGPLWSLAVEEQFYFAWPAVVLLSTGKSLRKIAAGIMVTAPVLRALCTPLFSNSEPIYNLTPFRADLLACGALIAVSEIEEAGWIVRHRRPARYGLLGSGILLAVLSQMASFRANANTVFFNTLGYSLIVVFFGSVLVETLNLRGGIFHRILTTRALTFLGLISYTFYLYQLPILLKVAEHVHSRAAIALLSFVITGTIAAISWRYLESPLLKHEPGFTPEEQSDSALGTVGTAGKRKAD